MDTITYPCPRLYWLLISINKIISGGNNGEINVSDAQACMPNQIVFISNHYLWSLIYLFENGIAPN